MNFLKDILLIISFALVVFFGMKYFNKKDDLKIKEEKLNIEYKKMENDKDSINKIIFKLNMKIDSIRKINNGLEIEIKKQDIKIIESEKKSIITQEKLEKMIEKIKVIRRKIKYLKQNPTKKVGNDLTESLKNKL